MLLAGWPAGRPHASRNQRACRVNVDDAPGAAAQGIGLYMPVHASLVAPLSAAAGLPVRLWVVPAGVTWRCSKTSCRT
jgi:hypothetical protein